MPKKEDTIRKQLTNPALGRNAITVDTLSNPSIAIHLLIRFVDMCTKEGSLLWAFPALSLIDLVASEVLDPAITELSDFSHLKAAQLLEMLNMPMAAQFRLSICQPLGVRRCTYLANETEVERRLEQAQLGTLVQHSEILSSTSNPVSRNRVQNITIRQVWALQATVLMELGLFQPARELLVEASRHNRAYADSRNSALCSLVLAQLKKLEGDNQDALEFVRLAQKEVLVKVHSGEKVYQSVVQHWHNVITTMVECLQELDKIKEVHQILDSAYQTMYNFAFSPHNQQDQNERRNVIDRDALVSASLIASLHGKVKANEALVALVSGVPTWVSIWKDAESHLKSACDLLADNDGREIYLITCLINYADCLMNKAKKLARRVLFADAVISAHPHSARVEHDEDDNKAEQYSWIEACALLERASGLCSLLLQDFQFVGLSVAQVSGLSSPPLSIEPEETSFPLERVLAQIETKLAYALVQVAKIERVHQEMLSHDLNSNGELDSRHNRADVVKNWLQHTKDQLKALDRPDQLVFNLIEQALAHATSAFNVSGISFIKSKALVSQGMCLRLLAREIGLMNNVWKCLKTNGDDNDFNQPNDNLLNEDDQDSTKGIESRQV